MAIDSQGRYHLNPQIARMHDRDAALKAVAKPPEHKAAVAVEEPATAVHHIEFHHHPDGGGKIKSVTHRHDGTQEEAEHENVHDAADHLTESMGDDGSDEMGEGDQADAEQQDEQQ